MKPKCINCNHRNVVSKGRNKSGQQLFRNMCNQCYKAKKLPEYSHYNFKKDTCELCNFKAVNMCQMDIDHIDGNHTNNHPSNLQTLCANCHRLKTYLNFDNRSNSLKLSDLKPIQITINYNL